MSSHGIDISNWQGGNSLDQMLTLGDDFCFLKATESTNFRDSYFADWWEELHTKGIIRGAYHYGQPGNPVGQAEFFWDTVSAQGFDDGDWLILDIEEDFSGITSWCEDFMGHLETLRGNQNGLIIYASRYYANVNLGSSLYKYPLWVADYTGTGGSLSGSLNWKGGYLYHQYTSSPIDQSWSPKTVAELDAIAGGDHPDPPPPGPTPGPTYEYPLPHGYFFGWEYWGEESISGWYHIVFEGVTSDEWIRRFGNQLSKRGWSIGKGKDYLTVYGNDGYYGDEWNRLVYDFQRDQHLYASGLIDADTWHAAFNNPVTVTRIPRFKRFMRQ